jgi:isochorismate synthase
MAEMRRGSCVLVRHHIALPACDPWAVAQACGPAEGPRALWHDGGRGATAAGWGAGLWQPLERTHAAAQAQTYCRLWGEAVQDMVPAGLESDAATMPVPLAFVALAFEGGTAASGQPDAAPKPWGALAGGVAFVPQCIIWAPAGGPCRAVLSAVVPSGDAVADVAARLRQQAADVQAAVACTVQQADVTRAASKPATDGTQTFGGMVAAPTGPSTCEETTARKAWVAGVAAAQRQIETGGLDKVVLARAACFAAPAGYVFDAMATAYALRAQHPGAMVYVLGAGDGTHFVGATPEILLRVQGHTLQTQAVAGTAPRASNVEQDAALGAALMCSAKDRGEHAVVVEGLEADLRPVCTELVRPPMPRLLRLARLQHLETPVTAILHEAGAALALCARLHPTPATCGWPRAAAQAWLARHEHLDRGLYAGPIGWVSAAGDGTFAVALRSAVVTAQTAWAFAGAGIVPASEAQAEWHETQLKLTTARDALRLRPCSAQAAVQSDGPEPGSVVEEVTRGL